MSSLMEYRRRSVIPLIAVALALYYLFVYVPLGRRAQDLDQPLQKSWKSLAAALGQTNTSAIDFLHITNQLGESREALALLEMARKKVAARIELDAALREKLSAPFQLVDYQNARSKLLDTIAALAKKQGVALDPAVLAGFPEHTADITQPELLWAALSMVDALLVTAVECKVGAIHSLEAPLALTNSPPTTNVASLAELPFQLELTGPAASVAKYIQYLPLRDAEAKRAGLQSLTNKPPLFIDRLVLRKQAPEKPDEVHLSLRVVGFVLRE